MMAEEKEKETTIETKSAEVKSGDMDQNTKLKAVFCYFIGWVSGLIMLLVEKDNQFVRFHAAQSIIVFGFFTLLGFVPYMDSLISLAQLLGVVLWVVLMVKAYQGQMFKLPVVGDYAEQLAGKK